MNTESFGVCAPPGRYNHVDHDLEKIVVGSEPGALATPTLSSRTS
jgi:hypothetical protein